MSTTSRSDAVVAALGIEVRSARAGRTWIDCPFHEDPADRECFVRTRGDRAGTFHCFSCSVGGGIWKLAAKVRGLAEEDARAFVRAAGKGFAPRRIQARVVEGRHVLGRRRFEMPSGVIVDRPLEDWTSIAREYAEGRGIDQRAVDEYGLGYATTGSLACRIVFPVVGAGGRLASYSARSFIGEEPRYKTPRDDAEPDKDAIFGAHLWPPPDERRAVVLTEGAIDAYSARRASGLPSGSLSGSDVRAGHIIALATFAVVVVLTDADAAGDKAAAKILASGLGRRRPGAAETRVVRVRLHGADANKLLLRDRERLRTEILRAATGSAP